MSSTPIDSTFDDLNQLLLSQNQSKPTVDILNSVLFNRFKSNLNDVFLSQSILLHLNPITSLDHQQHHLQSFSSTTSSNLLNFISKVVFTLKKTRKTQSIIHSGFSGSGKSTCLKLSTLEILKLSTTPSDSNQAKLSSQISNLFNLINSFTQIKSFNRNSITSSKLSTLLEIHFDRNFNLIGSKILIDGLKNLLKNPANSKHNYRNFNIFYQLLIGIPSQDRQSIALYPDSSHYELLSSNLDSFKSIQQSIDDNDLTDFQNLLDSFKSLGFKQKHIQSIFKLLSSILLLSNLQFQSSNPSNQNQSTTFISNQDSLSILSDLLGISIEDFNRILTNKVQYVRKEIINIILRPDGAIQQRDDFMNALYGVLVAYVFETVNHKLFPGDTLINQIQKSGGSSIIQYDYPGLQGRSHQFSNRGSSSKGLERSSTLIDRAKNFGVSSFEEFFINYRAELINNWFLTNHLNPQSSRQLKDGINLTHLDESDLIQSSNLIKSSQTILELLRGGQFGGKADTKPGGIIGGLSKTSNSFRKGKFNLIQDADNDVLDSMRSHFSSHPTFISRPNHSTTQSVFGIHHFSGPVSYDINGFVQSDLGLIDIEFVNLLRTSNDPFISRLFSGPSLSLDRHPLDSNVLVAAQVSSIPLRRPTAVVPAYPQISHQSDLTTAPSNDAATLFDSTVPLIDTSIIQPNSLQINATLSQYISHFNQCQVWHIINFKPNEELANNDWDSAQITHQLEAFQILELLKHKKVDYPFDFDLTMFSIRFQLQGTESSDLRRQLIDELMLQEGKDFTIGRSRVWLSFDAFQTLEERLPKDRRLAGSRRQSIADHWIDIEGGGIGSYHAAGGSGSGDELLSRQDRGPVTLTPAMSGYEAENNIPQSPGLPDGQLALNEPFYGTTAFRDGTTHSRVWGSEWESKPPLEEDEIIKKESNYLDPSHLKNGGDVVDDKIDGNTNPSGATDDILVKGNGNQTLEEIESSKARRWWVMMVWGLTFYVPNGLLSAMGKMTRPDVQMAWREKVALCIIIFLMCGMVLFVILGLGKILCPNLAKAWNLTELGYHATESDYFVGVRGQVFDLTKFWRGQHSDILAQQSTNADMLALAGQDLTNYFPIPLKLACPNVQTDTVTLQYSNWTATIPNAVHVSGSNQVVKSSALADENWYPKRFLPFISDFYKGPIVYGHKLISSLAQNRSIAIYNGGIYDLTDFLYTYNTQNLNSQYQYIDKAITDLFQQQPGQDLTKSINSLSLNATSKSASLTCLRNMFYLGEIDFREGPKCTVANYILLAFTILIAAAVVAKFVAALQLGTKRMPELRDKFVICQVPCYTEGEESLKKTIDSLATLKYDDKRKLIFVICDGMIIGSGNDRPTPRIVLDLLGVDPSIDPDPLLFQSVSEGSKQLNYGKVYSGLYEVDGHVVPYVVVVKVGKPSERSKPGNRGKRDSQILLMRFLNRIHFDAPMCPLELEICHQIKNVIGVEPQLYEFLFTIDADTEVYPDSLNRLVSAASDDGRIIGICGETKLSNEKVSWWTMIQVYEYYISHHLAKAFESLFGSVTCLPGCFTLYRIRSADKGRPLVVSNLIIDEYAEIHVDTLHKKNLFSLGEDRYFTTLLMKHFPHYKTKFIADATAMTAAPETWAVLLSQRRRWINSTIHNLGELMFLEDMCGFCCFSMRFFVILDLVGTVVLPSTTVYIVYLIILVSTKQSAVPIISLIIIGAVYGLQAVIFLLKREWGLIFWLLIYLMAYPIWSFFLPIYSFWHFDDFSWGNTRVVVGEGKHKKVLADQDDSGFDPSMIPLRKFGDYQAAMWDEDAKSSRVGYGRRPESVGGFSMASRPMMGGGAGSVMGGMGDYYRDGPPRSATHRGSALNVGSHNRSNSRSPSQHGSMGGQNAMGLNDFGAYFPPGLAGHRSMMSMGGGRAMSMMGGAGAPSVMTGLNPMGIGGNASVRGSMMDLMGGGGSAHGPMMMGVGGYPSTMNMGPGTMGGDAHARNMSMFSMGGMMPTNGSIMMGGYGTPSMMMNPLGTQMFGGGMMMGNAPGMAGGAQPGAIMMKNMNAEPSEEEIVGMLKLYLSQQDLMKITKRSVREAISKYFPNANLNERKVFINDQIDKILAGNN
ncbi:hypothetical protein O181_032196 [Austropuccinia psidii MF-1]|uniref:chitin synthase n=1 Tax=Austropuccinia psidii MF-1 TaxID=1389203 RepID=A0A9Q3CWB9_9BASI|nr:hypothetical protein [Austropuccinia psidii MF-1]